MRRHIAHTAVALMLLAFGCSAVAESDANSGGVETEWTAKVEQLAMQAARAALGPRSDVRIEVLAGKLDPRLRLAPCARVDFFLPAGQRAWGTTRVGIRCLEGPTKWSVYLPLTVKVWAPAVQSATALPSGIVLGAEHLTMGLSDWALADQTPASEIAQLTGRQLARPVAAGETLREADLRRRQWFSAGEPVTIVAVGKGFSATSIGIALTPGVEGQTAKVRTEDGRTLAGIPKANRRIEIPL